MIALLVWLAGTVGLGYEIVKHHLWQPGIAAATDVCFLAWVVGGAAWLAARMRGPGRPGPLDRAWQQAARAAAARAEALEKDRQNVSTGNRPTSG